jgi:acyl-coenzyme A thioesterase PaaI-like protein
MATEDDGWIDMEDHGFVGLVGPIQYQPCTGGTGWFRFRAGDKHRNRKDVVHGGMLMTSADRALGTTARQGDWTRRQATVQFGMHFTRPAIIGQMIEMKCRITRETRSLVFVEGTMVSPNGIVATANGIWKITSRV